MPKFQVAVPHSMPRESVTEKLKSFGDQIAAMGKGQVKDVEQSWSGDTLNFSFKTLGSTIAGKLEVTDDQVRVEGDLPFAAALFKGKIESSIGDQLGKLLR